jgi:predicted nucleotidyltransferase
MRQTQVVDFLMVEEDYDKIRPFFEQSGCPEIIRNNLFARIENKKMLPSELDIVFVNQKTFEGILEDSETAEIQGIKFKVPNLDHLLALKLHAMKQNLRRRGFRDITDVLDLAERNHVDVRGKKFQELCLKYAGKEVYRVVQELLKK